mmetsp:Transcript_3913/g.4340  ORF Transcript_3913/g.4340 Transcript_3913/m.4340 type:complete len:85 (-) Transcript_3913:48-302(-)
MLTAKKQSTNGKGPIPAKGIYFARDVEQCYKAPISFGGATYEVAFQCRVHPDHVWETGNGQTWIVVDETKYVRPYGIVLRKIGA